MLVQSHQRPPGATAGDEEFILHLLPALPKAWPDGSVTGLTARGGIVVDLVWKDGRLTRHRLHSRDGRAVQALIGSDLSTVKTESP